MPGFRVHKNYFCVGIILSIKGRMERKHKINILLVSCLLLHLVSAISKTALNNSNMKINNRMKSTNFDSIMFSYFIEHHANIKINYEEIQTRLSTDNQDYNFYFKVGEVLDQFETFRKKLRNVGDYLRSHKFNEYDWRLADIEYSIKNLTWPSSLKNNTRVRAQYFSNLFPEPQLQHEHELKAKCEQSAWTCILEVDRIYR